MKTNRIITGEALEELKKLPDESIDCVMTSPPYWGLRDYGHDNQLGLEKDFRDYIENLCLIFDEVKRVLKPTGTCWVNMGDTYASTPAGNKGHIENDLYKGTPKGENYRDNLGKASQAKAKIKGVEQKSLIQIPSRFAIAMTDRGWILRNEIIWYKKNVMPSSVKDRFTVDFEKIFFFTKNKKYYFEQQFEPVTDPTYKTVGKLRPTPENAEGFEVRGGLHNQPGGRESKNKRTVWQINPQPFSEAHFAVFPPKLVETPIKSGCPEFICKKCKKPREPIYKIEKPPTRKVSARTAPGQTKQGSLSKERFDEPIKTKVTGYTDCGCKAGWNNGVVLDPFFGSGTTALVAEKLNRKWLGIELNKEYVKIAEKRLGQQGLGI